MVEILAGELAEICGGTLLHGSDKVLFSGVSIDSRTIKKGEVFFAICGNAFDGHAFIDNAFEKGAAGAVVSRADAKVDGRPLILVRNTLTALQQLAVWWRQNHFIPVVAVTGSSGKTTTKDILAALLGAVTNVHFNSGNQNNEIGVPLTLLGLSGSHRVCVLEMGMRGLGEIAELCSVAQPTAGIITNVGSTHFERLGSVENIAIAKGELAASLPDDGFVMLNAENEWSADISRMTNARPVLFGLGSEADVRASEVDYFPEYTEFTLSAFGISLRLKMSLWGEHNVYNCLAAAGAYLLLGFPAEKLQAGLKQLSVSGMRLEKTAGIRGSFIINDTYNANPSSVLASLDVIRQINGSRTVIVLGDMFELGEIAEREHCRVGEAVHRLQPGLLVTVGDLAAFISRQALACGMEKNAVFHGQTVEEAVEFLRKSINTGDIILVKGSRGMKMERIVSALQAEENHE